MGCGEWKVWRLAGDERKDPVTINRTNAGYLPSAILVLSLLSPLALAQSTGNWTMQFPQHLPPQRAMTALAYDSAHGQTVMFGGNSGGSLINDTWLWNGTDWAAASPRVSPIARSEHVMAYDALHEQVVLFSGFPAGYGIPHDTWVWDGENWTQKFPATSPEGRTFAAMVYDAAHGQVVLFGGVPAQVGPLLNDTWVWDGENWTEKTPANSPPARSSHGMAYDSAHGRVVLFGGTSTSDTWLWDGTNWTQASPQTSPCARSGFAMAYDAAHGYVVIFGGMDRNNNSLDDTWMWDGTNWTQASPKTSPPGRELASIAYDAGQAEAILFGGAASIWSPSSLGDTWLWNGGAILPAISAVVNGASFVGGGVVPGEIATAFGTNLTSSAGINLTSLLPLTNTLMADALMVNDQPVALFAVDNVNGQQQINFQVPWEVASGPSANIAVSNNGTIGASISAPVLAAQPGIFNYNVGGNTFGAILHANYQLATAATPAKPGETVLIYCTGLGAVSSPPADGEAGKGQPTMSTPTVSIGGTKAIVSFSGLAPGFVGLYQINAEIPAGLKPGNQPVVITIAEASSNSVLLPVG